MSDTTVVPQQTFTPLKGHLQQVIAVEYVRSGQPRAYADHWNVMRVHFITHNNYTQKTEPDDPERYHQTVEYATETAKHLKDETVRAEYVATAVARSEEYVAESLRRQVMTALSVLGLTHLADENGNPLHKYGDWDNPTWLEHARHVAPGVVEVSYKSLFFD